MDNLYLKEFIDEQFPGEIEETISIMEGMIIKKISNFDSLGKYFNNLPSNRKKDFFNLSFIWSFDHEDLDISEDLFSMIHHSWVKKFNMYFSENLDNIFFENKVKKLKRLNITFE
jgi:hypothetical protein